jgi:hypothetical protein
VIITLLEHAAKEAEERRRKWEIQRQEMERREAERRRVEREAEREKEIVETISKWRLACDVHESAFGNRCVLRCASSTVKSGSSHP